VTGKPLIIVAVLIFLFTFLLLRSRIPEHVPRTRMQEVLQSIQLRDAELNRDVLMARADLLPNYDSFAETAGTLSNDLETLQNESADLTRDSSGTVKNKVDALTTAFNEKLAAIEHLKLNNALLRNSMSYFGETRHMLQVAPVPKHAAIAAASLSDVILRFVHSPKAGVRKEAQSVLTEVSRLPAQPPGFKPVAVHARIILDVTPKVDVLLHRIVSSPTAAHAEALQKIILEYGGNAERSAHKFRLLLYVAALAMLGYVIFLLTRLRARSRELRRKEMQLIQANKMTSLGTLVSGVAHEINNPTQVVLMNSGILANAWNDAADILETQWQQGCNITLAGLPYSEMRGTMSELTRQMHEGAQRIERIIGDLKNFARPCASLRERFYLNDVVQRALRLLTPVICKRTDRFRFKPATGLPPLEGTPQQLEQVVVNLVINALEALPNREGAVTVSTSFDPDLGIVVLDVQDDGMGIARENICRLGEPFFTTKEATGGTGLGIAISSSLVRSHDGRLLFQSVQGKGTRARVELPYSIPSPAPETSEIYK